MKPAGAGVRTDPSEAPAPPGLTDDGTWGFHALDGLPDVDPTRPAGAIRRFEMLRLSSGEVAPGLDDDLMEKLARARVTLSAVAPCHDPGGDCCAELSPYETEAVDAMTARRDAAVHLQAVLADDIEQYDGGVAAIRAGYARYMLDSSVGGNIRQSVSEAMGELEAARHRFRLALVAVALDNGMTAGQIGAAFAFSRQLASRYLKEARQKWPELAEVPTGTNRHATPRPIDQRSA